MGSVTTRFVDTAAEPEVRGFLHEPEQTIANGGDAVVLTQRKLRDS